MKTFTSAGTVEIESKNELRSPMEMLYTRSHRSALSNLTLSLKKGFLVMLLRNLDPENGHVNETRYIVENMTNNVLFLRVTTGMQTGTKLILLQINCGFSDDSFPVQDFMHLQLPIPIFFAKTTNNAQGLLFEKELEVDLRKDCFPQSQF